MEHIDLYCERSSPEFWAEPINALTNASFLIAAGAIWFTSRRSDTIVPAVWLFIALAAAIGIGSFVFHTVATSPPRSTISGTARGHHSRSDVPFSLFLVL